MSEQSSTDRHPLPLGYQSFSDLRQDGYYHVDKTPLIRQMIDEGRYYFLSRPCRFGKSLLASTLEELFEGNESLFEGLDSSALGLVDQVSRCPLEFRWRCRFT